jgi:hypothetical protein
MVQLALHDWGETSQMNLRELFNEDTGDTGGNGGRKGKTGKLHSHHKSAIKNMTTYPELPGWYYDMYRFGVNMAGSPADLHPMDQKSHTANQLATFAYTDAEEKIINKSKKNMGLKGKTLTSKNSEEAQGTNTKSTVAKHRRNQYGI